MTYAPGLFDPATKLASRISSITAATARSVSTIRNDSACSLAGRMLMPRLRAALASVSCLMLVVPEVEATGLPLRSSIELSLLDFFETKRVAVRKWVLVKETCFRRSGLLVVEPHSRSMVPFASNGMRDDEVTGLNSVVSLSSLSSFFTAWTIFRQMSIAKPIGFWLSSRYENGIDESR